MFYGQESFKKNVNIYAENHCFPRFSIIVGRQGSGRKSACHYIASVLGADCLIWGNKIDEIRELKSLMENVGKTVVYCIPEYETMSVGARNSILKMCEEAPRGAYIVLTSSSKYSVMPTILGRGTVFELGEYSEEDLLNIVKENNLDDSLLEVCTVPGELFTEDLKVDEFKEFVENVWNNIGKASAGNVLKITSRLKLKEDGQGYDLSLFLNYLYKLVSECSDLNLRSFALRTIIEAKKGVQLRFNKQYIVDNLLLDLRSLANGTI